MKTKRHYYGKTIETLDPADIPWFEGLVDLVRSCIGSIDGDCRATDDPEDYQPGMQLTIGCDKTLADYGWQTGDNSYTGGAYSFPFWGVAYLFRDSDPEETAREMVEEILESLACG